MSRFEPAVTPNVQGALDKLQEYRDCSQEEFPYPEANEYIQAVAKLSKTELFAFMELAKPYIDAE